MPREGTSAMTHFLVSPSNKDGYLLEDILMVIRKDVLTRCVQVADDHRPEALLVMQNNTKILDLLSQCITVAQHSTEVLNKAFGPSETPKGGKPRIGK